MLGPEQLPGPWEDVQILWHAFEPYVLIALGLILFCAVEYFGRQYLAWRKARQSSQFREWLDDRARRRISHS